ncbi:MAG: hypothetical protein EOM05_01775 [Clostridia bacterium]|nr:hypothetical protein [Clostridia bacterium]
MTIKDLWHKVFGIGSVTDEFDDYVLVNFHNVGEKKISNSVWGTILFFSIEDFKDPDKQKIKEKYSKYLPEPITVESKEAIVEAASTNEDCIDVFNFPTIDERMLFDSFDGVMKRNIVIILCQKTKRGGKPFLRIIGIDVFTGKVVNVVDTNGSEYGLHSYHNELAKLKEQTVIQAELKTIKNKFHLNTLRIVSPIRILGKCNVPKLKEKYQLLHPSIPDFIHNFAEAFAFCSEHKNSRSYFIVNFTGTQIQPHKDRYQLKMDKYFVDIRDVTFDFKRNGNKFYHGWTILQCDAGANGECRFSAQRLIGKFLTKEEFEKYKEDRKIRCYDDYSVYEDSDFIVDDSFEYDEEYEAYENECVEELTETYKEHAGDILDEYSEYAEDWDEEGYYGEDR